jgi:hypothetical protein
LGTATRVFAAPAFLGGGGTDGFGRFIANGFGAVVERRNETFLNAWVALGAADLAQVAEGVDFLRRRILGFDDFGGTLDGRG